MTELKPALEIDCFCPECGAKSLVDRINIPGMSAYAECTCAHCGLAFMQMLPSGHYINAPLAVGKSSYRIYHGNQDYRWLADLVSKSFPLLKGNVAIDKRVYSVHQDVIILNALDFLYGHSLLKLYNAQYHLDHEKDRGLVIILPKIFEWMIPKGCAEAWIVDLTLNDLRKGYDAIAEFVSAEMKRFRQVHLSRAYSHPDFITVDIERFTGIKPFDLRQFNKLKPCITFVLREDRWWLATQAEYWMYRFFRKLKMMKTGNSVLAKRQTYLVKRTIRAIKKNMPSAVFNIVGIGKTGTFKGLANDKRTLQVDIECEKEWCSLYSESHVVIGFHGSNMLLPTAFAAGCVEILPEDRYGNIVQDISVRYADRQQMFFYRFANQHTTPKRVARQAMAIISDYKLFHLNMCSNVYR